MRTFNFSSIFQRYAKDLHYLTVSYLEQEDEEEILEQSEKKPFRGIIVSTEIKWIQAQGGTYTLDDRILYTEQPFQVGTWVIDQGKTYVIQEASTYETWGKYALKRMSSYDPLENHSATL